MRKPTAVGKRWRITVWNEGFVVEAPFVDDALVEAVQAVVEDPSLLYATEIEEADPNG